MQNINLNANSLKEPGVKKYRVIYDSIKQAILRGELIVGESLPATRSVASLYKVSRGTVSLAYEMLWADGYLETKHGSGTFVSYDAKTKIKSNKTNASLRHSNWSKKINRVSQPVVRTNNKCAVNFSLGEQDESNFPKADWKKSMRRSVSHSNLQQLISSEGLPELRSAIAKHLKRFRGLIVNPDEVIITSGISQSLSLIAQICLDPLDKITIEEPSFRGIKKLAEVHNLQICLAPVDAQGAKVTVKNCRLALVTPGHQFPTGIVMSRDRRLELLTWARENNAIIIEDDIDCEFRRKGSPIEPLKSLDTDNRVIYLGSFSRTICRGLRLAYAILPKTLKPLFIKAKQLQEPYAVATIEQAALADFISSNSYEKHLRRMTRVLKIKHSVLMQTLNNAIPDLFNWNDSDVGTYIWGNWKGSNKAFKVFEQKCFNAGILWQNSSNYFTTSTAPAIVLGFSHLTSKEIQEAGKILKNSR